jgi:hypothetical protein
MNFSDVLMALESASAFDLFHLRAAIDRVLDQPGWMQASYSSFRSSEADVGIGQQRTYCGL